jgi:zinc protease
VSLWTDGVRRTVLPNGLTILIQTDPTAPAVALVSHVRAGFFDEPDAVAGVSHVLEHMLFKGTPTRAPGDIARETKAAGGYLNAGTGYDHTSYYTVLPPASLDIALDLQSDALRRSLIDPEELRRELRVIIEEAKRKLDTPSAVTGESLHAELFDMHRIRRWRIGTEAQLVGLSHADVFGYYRSRYVPGRTIVAIVGNVDADAAEAAAADAFEGWPGSVAAIDPSPEEPPRKGIRVRTLRGDVRQADLVLGWRGVPTLHADAAALDVAASILGVGRGSWLYRAMRIPGLVSSVGAWHFSPTEVGVFSIAAELEPAKLEAALDAAAAEVARLRSDGATADDLVRVRTLLRARWGRRLESTEGRAMALASAEALGGYGLLDEEFERTMAVDLEAVHSAAERYLDPDAVAVVAYLPDGRGTDLSVERIREVFSSPTIAPLPEATTPAPVVPRPRPARGVVDSGVYLVALPGVDLLVQRKSGVPLASLGLYRRRTMADTLKTAGLGALAARSAARGAGELDAGQLALAFERLGGGLSSAVTADWFGVGASVLAERSVEAMALLALVLQEPRFEPDEVARERGVLTEDARQAADDMVRWPIQLALRAAYGDTGYGVPAMGLPETVPTFTEGMVRAWHACELATGRTTAVAVGDLDPERFADAVAGLFDHGPRRSAVEIATSGRWRVAPGTGPATEVDHRVKRQTALALAFPGPNRRDARRYAALVWSAVASGLGGRLFDALRDRRSLAYTVLASSWQRAGAGALICYIGTSPEREDEAREQFLIELAKFRDEPASADELARAVNYLAGQAQVQRQTMGSIAGEIAEAWLVGEGLSELVDPAAPFRTVTVEAVRSLCEEFLDPGVRTEGVVRGAGPRTVSSQSSVLSPQGAALRAED